MGLYKKATGGPVQQGAATTQPPRPGTTAASTATTPRPGTASSNPRGGLLDVVKNPSNLITQAHRVMSAGKARTE